MLVEGPREGQYQTQDYDLRPNTKVAMGQIQSEPENQQVMRWRTKRAREMKRKEVKFTASLAASQQPAFQDFTRRQCLHGAHTRSIHTAVRQLFFALHTPVRQV